ncbi:hypothetical protein Q9966_013571 [Columba livia]|nr:hypothetical protein Q9966_013571 [Columba livia]
MEIIVPFHFIFSFSSGFLHILNVKAGCHQDFSSAKADFYVVSLLLLLSLKLNIWISLCGVRNDLQIQKECN